MGSQCESIPGFNSKCGMRGNQYLMEIWEFPCQCIYSFKCIYRVQNICLFLQVKNLFCLGSPLAVFLALRGMKPISPSANTINTAVRLHSKDREDDFDSDVDDEDCPASQCTNRYDTTAGIASSHSFPNYPDERHLHNSDADFRLFNIFNPRDPVVG